MVRLFKFFGGLILLGCLALLFFHYFDAFTDPVNGLLTTTVLGTLPWEDWELAAFVFAPLGIVIAAGIYMAVQLAKGDDSSQGL